MIELNSWTSEHRLCNQPTNQITIMIDDNQLFNILDRLIAFKLKSDAQNKYLHFMIFFEQVINWFSHRLFTNQCVKSEEPTKSNKFDKLFIEKIPNANQSVKNYSIIQSWEKTIIRFILSMCISSILLN